MYKLSRKAEQDIELLYDYSLTQFGEMQAERYLLALEKAFFLLVDFPKLGKQVDEIRPNLRCYFHRSHAVYYQIIENGVLIVRVLDQRMDHTRLFH